MTRTTRDNKKEKWDFRVKVDGQDGKGVRYCTNGDETIEGW